jgi:hypothetical protein
MLTPLIEALAVELRPVFLATLERGAGQRYREWALQTKDPDEARGLLACAAREEEIASRVEKLFPVGAEARAQIDAAVPEARSLYYSIFTGCSLGECFELQAAAERQGALAWRLYAAQQDDPEVKQTLLSCADLEEASASYLESR